MKTLPILIEDYPTGPAKRLEVACEIPLFALMPVLVNQLRLPRNDLFGQPLVYRLRPSSEERVLPAEKSLAALGYPPESRFVLSSYVLDSPEDEGPRPVRKNQGRGQPPLSHAQQTVALTQEDLAQEASPAAATPKRPRPTSTPKHSRRSFLILGGSILGVSTLGLGLAAGLAAHEHPSLFSSAPRPTGSAGPPTQPSALPNGASRSLVFTQHQQTVRAAAWSPAGQVIASGGDDGRLLIWDAQGNVHQQIPLGGNVLAIAWAPDGQLLAAGVGTHILLVNPFTGALEARFPQLHTDAVSSLSWSPRPPQRLVSTGLDRLAAVWDPTTHRPQTVFHGHAEPIEQGSWASDAQTVGTSSLGGVTRIWSAASGEQVHGYFFDQNVPMRASAFAPTGPQLAVGGDDGIIRLWNGLACQIQRPVDGDLMCADTPVRLRLHSRAVRSLAWSPDSRLLASGGEDATVIVSSPAMQHRPLLTLQQTSIVRAVAWSPGGSQVAAASGSSVAIWTLR